MTTTTIPAPSTKLPMDDPRIAFAKAIATAGFAIAGVRRDQMTNPTPCDEFDVRGLVGHFLAALERVTIVGRDGDPFAVGDSVEPLADDAWLTAWTALAEQAQTVWADDALLMRPTRLPWASESGAQALSSYVAEFTVHTWDLAVATGQTPDWDDEVVALGLAFMRTALPVVGRKEMFAAIRAQMGTEGDIGVDPYGAAVPVAADASLIDQLVAHNGRTPHE